MRYIYVLVCICMYASAYVSIRQHTCGMNFIVGAAVYMCQHTSAYFSIRQHTSAYFSIRQHTCGINFIVGAAVYIYVSMYMHVAYVRQHTLAYVWNEFYRWSCVIYLC
jgi:hypothetical protein